MTTETNEQSTDLTSSTDSKPLRFYSTQQIALSCYLFGPWAGCWFTAQNHRFLKDAERAKTFAFYGFIAATILAFVVPFLPEKTPNVAVPLFYTAIIGMYSNKLFNDNPELKNADASLKTSNWKVLGLGVIFLAATLIAVFSAIIILDAAHLLPE
ncbi:MAG: hypothetical protein OXT65_04905 [Alphaproteobacteria bacterium]|nr:hypothetical protein [Alphaproteobacteria bacterium]